MVRGPVPPSVYPPELLREIVRVAHTTAVDAHAARRAAQLARRKSARTRRRSQELVHKQRATVQVLTRQP
jgi:hypothetical protein